MADVPERANGDRVRTPDTLHRMVADDLISLQRRIALPLHGSAARGSRPQAEMWIERFQALLLSDTCSGVSCLTFSAEYFQSNLSVPSLISAPAEQN